MNQVLLKRTAEGRKPEGVFLSDVEEMNRRATRGNVSYGEKEYYIRKYEQYLMKELNKGYSDLRNFLSLITLSDSTYPSTSFRTMSASLDKKAYLLDLIQH